MKQDGGYDDHKFVFRKGAQKVMDKVMIQDSSSKFCTIASTTKPTVYRVGGKEVIGILKQ
jgi:hypothetical protein